MKQVWPKKRKPNVLKVVAPGRGRRRLTHQLLANLQLVTMKEADDLTDELLRHLNHLEDDPILGT
jgi:hypothetical protein